MPTQAVSSLPAPGNPRHKAWRAAAKGAVSKRAALRDARNSMHAEHSAETLALPGGSAAALADAGVSDS